MPSSDNDENDVKNYPVLSFGLMESSPVLDWIEPGERKKINSNRKGGGQSSSNKYKIIYKNGVRVSLSKGLTTTVS